MLSRFLLAFMCFVLTSNVHDVCVCLCLCVSVCVCVCVCVFYLYCSAQLSMFNMEKRHRNKIIIIKSVPL